MSFRTRNVETIISKEEEIFKRIGMEKIGYEGYEPNMMNGGTVWYMAKFPNEDYIYTISFISWFGHIRMDYMRLLNPKTSIID